METVLGFLLGALVLEIAGVVWAVVLLSGRSERRIAAQLAGFQRTQNLNQEERKMLNVAAAHGILDASHLNGALRDADAVYAVQLGDAPAIPLIDALCKTSAARSPRVFVELRSYVDGIRDLDQISAADRVQ